MHNELGRQPEPSCPYLLCLESRKVTDHKDIADCFNEFFCSITSNFTVNKSISKALNYVTNEPVLLNDFFISSYWKWSFKNNKLITK